MQIICQRYQKTGKYSETCHQETECPYTIINMPIHSNDHDQNVPKIIHKRHQLRHG